MFDNNNGLNGNMLAMDSAELKSGLNTFMVKVFGQMFLGLLLSALVGGGFILLLATNAAVQAMAANSFFIIGVCIVELALVIGVSAGINKLNAVTAWALYCLYAGVNGITLSIVMLAYAGTPRAIMLAFIMAAVFFGTMCVYGITTKADLTNVGRIFFVGLIAILIAMVVNLFLRSSSLDFIVCLAGVAVFTGLTAYDTQKLKTDYVQAAAQPGGEAVSKAATIGALKLYLDFINLFLMLLRILGRSR